MGRVLWALSFLLACHAPTSGLTDAGSPDASSPDVAPGSSLAIEPAAITVPAGGNQIFVATSIGASWSVVESGGGTIDAAGAYLAPDLPGTYHIVASDGVATATAVVTVVQLQLTVLTGGLGGWGTIDGIGASARFRQPLGLVRDGQGHAYVADGDRIRRVDLATHEVTTVAGGNAMTDSDGVGAAAGFVTALGLALDGQTLYVADEGDGTIRAVDLATATVTTVAGQHGVRSLADGIGTAATFGTPFGMCLSGTTLYIADESSQAIRAMNTITHEVTTVAGTPGVHGHADSADPHAATFFHPRGLACTATTVYVADFSNGAIRTIDRSGGASDGTVATLTGGIFNAPFTDGAFATAGLPFPEELELDATGSILYASEAHLAGVRELDLAAKTVTTIAIPPPAHVGEPAPEDVGVWSLAAAGATLLVAYDTELRALDLATATTTVIAGRSRLSTTGSTDGTFAEASFAEPAHLATFGSDVYVSEIHDGRGIVRAISLAAGTVRRLAGQGGSAMIQDGPDGVAAFDPIYGLAVDATGALWVTDQFAAVRSVAPDGTVTTRYGKLATNPNTPFAAHVDDVGTQARFESPTGIVAMPGALIVTDNAWASTGNTWGTIRRVDRASDMVSTVAGVSGIAGDTDGVGTAALFKVPVGIAGDGDHVVWVADAGANSIRQIDLATGSVTTLAGEPTVAGDNDGVGRAAHFREPAFLAYDGRGSLYVAEDGWLAPRIRRIWVASGAVSTIVGRHGDVGVRLGPLETASLNYPGGLAITASGALLITSEQAVLAIVAE